MGTFLFDRIVFGPVKSRRLGVSLGINLLPSGRKICNFNCIYCECGWTCSSEIKKSTLPKRKEIREALQHRLEVMKDANEPPDVITFAGNGEPTLHPEFPEIIKDTIELRDRYFPGVKIAVLSNSSTISNPLIREALFKVDLNILKLDSALDVTVRTHNQPRVKINIPELVENLRKFNGRVIIQTLFLRGSFNGKVIDNTTPEELEAWLKALEAIKPSEVMIYTISRDTPAGRDLKKVPLKELRQIAAMVKKTGIKTRVSG